MRGVHTLRNTTYCYRGRRGKREIERKRKSERERGGERAPWAHACDADECSVRRGQCSGLRFVGGIFFRVSTVVWIRRSGFGVLGFGDHGCRVELLGWIFSRGVRSAV